MVEDTKWVKRGSAHKLDQKLKVKKEHASVWLKAEIARAHGVQGAQVGSGEQARLREATTWL